MVLNVSDKRLTGVHACAGQIRPVLFVTARVHPGETPASFVCQGLVDWLLGGDPQAVQLRGAATVVVVPMLNPDGVFLGNYRLANSPCSPVRVPM